ncbi:MAG: 5-(carboxyamino)imidazole ribonucleotide synthase [Pseudomonadota bacterium]|nr:MAG: 5-(carboxyamino)imidazole ribonucleotide synthase [Pseudomonadota bacterium]
MNIGILGGGQLARMMAQAGIPMGLQFTFLDPKPDACAAALGRLLVADWDDAGALETLAECDRITCDFENVPAGVLERLAEIRPVRPGAAAFAAAQDRLAEKRLFESIGLEVAPFAPVASRIELLEALDRVGYPAVLKTRRMGYDGKGQYLLRQREDLEPAWAALGDDPLILEGWVPFDFECAITVARDAAGNLRCYPLTRTVHDNGMLALARCPAGVDAAMAAAAAEAARRLATHLEYVGCLTLELFAVGDRLLANEFAPRVHNSAHWTIEGTFCSQFENHLRAVCDLPLGDPAARGAALMVNWIGAIPEPVRLLGIDGLCWHNYGKSARPGRKVGHATLLGHDLDDLRARAGQLGPQLASYTASLLNGLMKVSV